MSISPAHAAAFYREVSEHQVVWAISDSGGFAAPLATDGKRAMPFWSSQSRANAIIAGVSAYAGFHPVAIDWKAFCERWVPGLTRDGLLAGINWSGPNASGFDVTPSELQRNVEALRHGRI